MFQIPSSDSPLSVSLRAERAAPAPSRLSCPVFASRVPAGFPSPADDYLDDGCDLNELMIRNAPSTFFFNVSGDSLDRIGIMDGDRVIVDRSLEPSNGAIVIAVLAGDITIKRLVRRSGRVWLAPDSHNPVHRPREIHEGEELLVWGVVTGLVRQLRK